MEFLPEKKLPLLRVTVLVMALLTAILFIYSIPQYYQYIKSNCIAQSCTGFYNPAPGTNWLQNHGISPAEYSFAYVSIYAVFGLVYITAGTVLLWKKSSGLIGLLGSFMLISLGGTFTPIMSGIKLIHPLLTYLVQVIEAGGMTAFILFFFLFPNGKFAPRWSAYLCMTIIILRVPGMLFPSTIIDLQHGPKLFFGIWFFIWIGSLISVQIFRYKTVLTPLEKQQAKWVVYGVVMALMGLMSVSILFIFQEKAISAQPYQLYAVEIGVHAFMMLIPLAILIAMLKHRLWDIDIIVNRTLVYGILTACTVLFYVTAVWYTGLLFDTKNHVVISFIATGIVAVLFSPIKQHIQRFINRRMYGENDDPYSVLNRLSKELENPLDPEAVLKLVIRTIKDSLRLPYASLSLHQNGGEVLAAEDGEFFDECFSFSLYYRGEEIGALKLSPRSPGERFTVSDHKFLDMLIRQASAVVQSAKASIDLKMLAADLQESREQLVIAREEERRELRSNLHDGLAPRLAALALTAAAAEDLVEKNPTATKEILSDLQSTIRQTVSEIRGIVYDLRPPTLDEMGLIGAIDERIKELSLVSQRQDQGPGIQFSLNAPEKLPVLPAAVEVAAFRILTEALVNVVRHSKATACSIRILFNENQEHGLHMLIEDNGVGLSPRKNREKGGIGMESMNQRANELGGKFLVAHSEKGGTKITVFLPVNS
ncbi:histidine kinase [Neobacillus sp. LXY-1]|uniref:histidine kinase n=1 Tax=Neobacillus sp. LXY-1 TaxID=3379133 RepID=UPI003EE385CD